MEGVGVDQLQAAHLRNLHDEEIGVRHRMRHFYIPLMLAACRARGLPPQQARVLDCGCGNGLSVELLAAAGLRAFGVDPWTVREQQWPERQGGTFAVADGRALPFCDGAFDLLLSSGVLEHVGVEEHGQPAYTVRPLADQAAQRRNFLAECLRVLSPHGVLFLDHPNGAFPVDFWHNDYRSKPRWHPLSEGFLPTYSEVRRLVQSLDPQCRVEAISPARRFTFRRVGRRWYGKMLAGPVEAGYRLMENRAFAWVARSVLNPYLVLRITRS